MARHNDKVDGNKNEKGKGGLRFGSGKRQENATKDLSGVAAAISEFGNTTDEDLSEMAKAIKAICASQQMSEKDKSFVETIRHAVEMAVQDDKRLKGLTEVLKSIPEYVGASYLSEDELYAYLEEGPKEEPKDASESEAKPAEAEVAAASLEGHLGIAYKYPAKWGFTPKKAEAEAHGQFEAIWAWYTADGAFHHALSKEEVELYLPKKK